MPVEICLRSSKLSDDLEDPVKLNPVYTSQVVSEAADRAQRYQRRNNYCNYSGSLKRLHDHGCFTWRYTESSAPARFKLAGFCIKAAVSVTLYTALLGCSECSVTDELNNIEHYVEGNSQRDGREWIFAGRGFQSPIPQSQHVGAEANGQRPCIPASPLTGVPREGFGSLISRTLWSAHGR